MNPPTLNSNVGASVTSFDDTVSDNMNDTQLDTSFLDGLDIISQADQMLNGMYNDVFPLSDRHSLLIETKIAQFL